MIGRFAQRATAFGQSVGLYHGCIERHLYRLDQLLAHHGGPHFEAFKMREFKRCQEFPFGKYHPVHCRHAARMGAFVIRQCLQEHLRFELRHDDH